MSQDLAVILNESDIARLLGVARASTSSLMYRWGFPIVRFGRRRYARREALLLFLADLEAGTEEHGDHMRAWWDRERLSHGHRRESSDEEARRLGWRGVAARIAFGPVGRVEDAREFVSLPVLVQPAQLGALLRVTPAGATRVLDRLSVPSFHIGRLRYVRREALLRAARFWRGLVDEARIDLVGWMRSFAAPAERLA